MKKTIALLLSALMLIGLAGCGQATVPDVTGKTLDEARSTLNDAGFYSINAKDLSGKAALNGTVRAQDPEAGKEASTVDTVNLTIETEADKATKQATSQSNKIKQLAEELKGKPAKDAIEQLKKGKPTRRNLSQARCRTDEQRTTHHR
mgnify:CR=1 FL=1